MPEGHNSKSNGFIDPPDIGSSIQTYICVYSGINIFLVIKTTIYQACIINGYSSLAKQYGLHQTYKNALYKEVTV